MFTGLVETTGTLAGMTRTGKSAELLVRCDLPVAELVKLLISRKIMKIILAPDSFKDSLSGIDICSILADAARRELGDVEIRCFPMGDGGEGTLDAVLAATNGRRETLLVRDPLGRPVEAAYASLPNGEAFVEMAQMACVEITS